MVSVSLSASLVQHPPFVAQSPADQIAFSAQFDELLARLRLDAELRSKDGKDLAGGKFAEEAARQLRKEIQALPVDLKKDGIGAGSIAQVWFGLMMCEESRIMSELLAPISFLLFSSCTD